MDSRLHFTNYYIFTKINVSSQAIGQGDFIQFTGCSNRERSDLSKIAEYRERGDFLGAKPEIFNYMSWVKNGVNWNNQFLYERCRVVISFHPCT